MTIMPVYPVSRIFDAASHLSVNRDVTHSDLLGLGFTWVPLILGIVGILVTVIFFVVAEKRYGERFKAERRERAEERDQELRRQMRAAENESWQSEFEEIRSYQLRAEQKVDRILAQPNLCRSATDDAELEELEQRFEAVSRRCPQALTPSLRSVSETVMRLRKIKLPTDREVRDAYQRALTHGGLEDLGYEWLASALGAKVVEQYCAASHLRRAIDEVWRVLRKSRGEI